MPDPGAEGISRQTMEADIACAGFGPGMGGFLTTLAGELVNPDGSPRFPSEAAPGMPLQVLCYERADDLSFGVSGIVTRARSITASFPGEDLAEQIPMAARVTGENLLYLLDPVGASRRPLALKLADAAIRALSPVLPLRDFALAAPFIPPFMKKEPGLVMSMGQFSQWVSARLMATGLVQLWPGSPVDAPLIENGKVAGLRLADQGVNRDGSPGDGFMPGMDVKARLTVVGDGPFGPVGRGIDASLGMPPGNHRREWALGMKMVVQLPADTALKPGTVWHTFGYPEPDIFGFLYVYPGNMVSLGIFIPSWLRSPVRTAYRYLQHWIQHPYIWRHLKGGELKSWGAKSLQESGRDGEPFLAGEGYARIGEGSGSTNVLAGSGVDEAWMTGVLLAQGVTELLGEGKPFTKENLERAYVARRRASWVDKESRAARGARNGFMWCPVAGMAGMALAGFTRGLLRIPARQPRPWEVFENLEEYFHKLIPATELTKIKEECERKAVGLHDAVMDRAGWPNIEFDGKLLVSHQDALLMGGKVQAPAGYADHVRFASRGACKACTGKVCIEMCSGQAITPGEEGVPAFDREKCIHCGACLWNCSRPNADDPELTNVDFRAGSGGLHSSEN